MTGAVLLGGFGAVLVGGWSAAVAAGLAAAGARRSSVRRAEAVASACHEVRGPLTSLRLGLEFAARPGELSPARLRAMELELERAVLALDDLSRADGVGVPGGRRDADGGETSGEVELVDVRCLVGDSVEAWRGFASERGVALSLSWTGGRAFVIGQRPRLAQATSNLIANAIEHGAGGVAAKGTVAVSAGAPASAAAAQARPAVHVHGRATGSTVRIEVCDDGPGLPAGLADLARPRRGEPRGRGLAIARATIAAHGGTLTAAVGQGSGATVVIELPAA